MVRAPSAPPRVSAAECPSPRAVIGDRGFRILGRRDCSLPSAPGARAYEAMVRGFEAGIMIRVTGDIIALSPPLILEKTHIDEIFGKLAAILATID